MNIGIVTTWFERGAAYVSKQIKEALEKEGHEVFIYARGGENYAIGDLSWDTDEVHWSKKIESPFSLTLIHKREFEQWLRHRKLDAVLFNEQRWMQPVLWCNKLGVKTICYVDYYREDTLFQFQAYDALICNTKRHYSVFKDGRYNAYYLPWGTDIHVFNTKNHANFDPDYTIFHSAGMNPVRKGTDILIKALDIDFPAKVLIQSQKSLTDIFPELSEKIQELVEAEVLDIIEETIPWPGLYHRAKIYVYPSRLDGIGLTLLEAMASGCFVVTTNEGPMNEFVEPKTGVTVPVNKRFSRWDGYYWPVAEVDPLALKKIIYDLARDQFSQSRRQDIEKVVQEKYDWSKNSKKLDIVFTDTKVRKIPENIKEKINSFDYAGIKRVNRILIPLNSVYRFFRNLLRLVN